MGRRLLDPRREGRAEVQGLPAAAALPQAPVRRLRRRDRPAGRGVRRPRRRRWRSPRPTTSCCASTCRPRRAGRVISGRDAVRLADRRPGPLDRAEGHRRAPDQGGARRRAAQPVACRASSTSSTSPPSATASATSTRPSCAASSRPSPTRATASASPTCSPTSSAAPTSTCCGSSPRARARAPASSSRRPRSAS